MWRKIQAIHSALVTFMKTVLSVGYDISTSILHVDIALSKINQWIPLCLLKKNKIRIEKFVFPKWKGWIDQYSNSIF